MRALLSVFAFLLMGVSAHAQIHHGKDTISLSVANDLEAHQIAAEFCARGDKYRIIRVHGRYGDEIAINCLWKAPPAPSSASAQSGLAAAGPMTELSANVRRALATLSTSEQPGQPATNPMTELSANIRRALATLSVSEQPGQPATNPITELSAQFRRALTTLSAVSQPEMPEGETEPPARREDDSTVTRNTYGQPW
jgi:hypothetical protein